MIILRRRGGGIGGAGGAAAVGAGSRAIVHCAGPDGAQGRCAHGQKCASSFQQSRI